MSTRPPTTGARRAASRLRHPAMRQAIDLDRMRRREAARLAEEGHPWPVEAAMILAARGRMGLDRTAFAATLGVPEQVVTDLEEGTGSATGAPRG
jgi:DNA-binding transcriptional regulator YiaG